MLLKQLFPEKVFITSPLILAEEQNSFKIIGT
jgi:hypothetical protein